MVKAYEIAKQIMLTREDEIEDILDELATNWPNTYNLLAKQVKENIEWHLEEFRC